MRLYVLFPIVSLGFANDGSLVLVPNSKIRKKLSVNISLVSIRSFVFVKRGSFWVTVTPNKGLLVFYGLI